MVEQSLANSCSRRRGESLSAWSLADSSFVPGIVTAAVIALVWLPLVWLPLVARAQTAPKRQDGAPADAARPAADARDRDAFFEARVRPVFVEHCVECHGPKKQEADLRLDSRAGAAAGGISGPAFVAGKPRESLLITAVRRDGELKMPPDKPLPPAAIEALERWIGDGAVWPAAPQNPNSLPSPNNPAATGPVSAAEHWAFQPIRPAVPPDVQAVHWPRGPLDRFVLQQLENRRLSPSPAADRRTLIRRLSFDLLGLPPDPDDVDAFVADEQPDAVERLVDRLLAAPQHGERWARHWLDVARYADNKGYVFFEEKNYTWAYTYRDYVIEALNRDLPYDRFVMEQLAADQLELGGDARPLRALGFLTLGAHFMNNTHDIVDDRIDVVTRGLLGLTATCARCHDHKYDPIPQADYYSLYGVFRSCEEPLVPPEFAPAPETDERKKFVEELRKRETALGEFVTRKHRDLVTGARARAAEYLMAAYAQRNQPATDDFMLIADPNDLNPTMILRWRVYLEKTSRQPHPIWAPWHRFAALPETQFARQAEQVVQWIAAGGDPDHPLNELVRSRLAALKPQAMSDVAAAYGQLLQETEAKWQAARAAATTSSDQRRSSEDQLSPPAALDEPAFEQLRGVLYGPDAPPDVPVLIGWGFLTLLPDRASQGEYQKLLKEVETWMISGPGAPPRAHVLLDGPQPFEPRVFLRGNPNRLGAPTPRQFLAAVNPVRRPFAHGSGRLELAREIVATTNPLTARVLVNRLWLHHFGAGLVRTPGDFGVRGERPSHPALLDDLAARFLRDGWSMKRVHRELVTSAAYGQSSVERPECLVVDPEDVWLWRMPSRRLEFESMRDALLSAAGRLDRRIGGPSVQLLGDAIVPRRTLYGFIDRLDVPTLLTTFDFPNPTQSNPRRDATTVAPQALYWMNHPLIADVARHLVQRPDVAGIADPAARADRLFRILFGRPATESERSRVVAFSGGGTDEESWRRAAHALLMTNEFLYID